MSGFITKKEVLEQKDFIIKTYGKEFFDDCLKCEGTTFLSMLMKWGKI